MAQVVFQWVTQLVSPNDGVAAQWVSLHQLLVLFQAQTGQLGVRHLSAKRKFIELTWWDEDFSWKEAVRDFGTFLRAISKAVGINYTLLKRRPAGSAIQCRPSCICIQIPLAKIFYTDELFLKRRLAPIKDVSRAFSNFAWVEMDPSA